MRKADKLTVGIYAIAFIISEFVTIGYASGNNLVVNLSLYAIGTCIVLGVIGGTVNYESPHASILDKIGGDENVRGNPKRWLELQRTIQSLEWFVFFVGFIVVGKNITFLPTGSLEGGFFLIAVFLIPIVGFYYFHTLRGILGMGFLEIEGSSLYGVKAFSKLAFDLLNQNEIKGVIYLRKSLSMLDSVLRAKEISSINVDKALKSVIIVCETATELPFKPLIKLSKTLSSFSSLMDLPEVLNDFVTDSEMKNAEAFDTITSSRRSQLDRITLIAVVLTAIATTIQAVLPESAKTQVSAFFVQMFSTPVIAMVTIAIVFAIN